LYACQVDGLTVMCSYRQIYSPKSWFCLVLNLFDASWWSNVTGYYSEILFMYLYQDIVDVLVCLSFPCNRMWKEVLHHLGSYSISVLSSKIINYWNAWLATSSFYQISVNFKFNTDCFPYHFKSNWVSYSKLRTVALNYIQSYFSENNLAGILLSGLTFNVQLIFLERYFLL
jgi:hypothetical protein